MIANQNRTRPATLVENSMYFLRDRPEARRQADWLPVKFVCYTPCPGVVIVRDLREKTLHVLRDELFFPALPRL